MEPHEHWFNSRLNDSDASPLATIWGIVPLFEAVNGVAIAKPSAAHVKSVRSFATFAERYWDNKVPGHGAYAAYPGNQTGREQVWFDDNGWWGLAFVNAYRATHDRRYLRDAERAMRFIDARGWDRGGGGMWWSTRHPYHSLDSLGSATALAAELYEYTGDSSFRKIAHTYIGWANRRAWHRRGFYATPTQPVVTYVEGAMIGAHLALCRMGERKACAKAEKLARASFRKWHAHRYQAPKFDTILFRYILELGAHDHNPKWYAWAKRAADDANRRARENGLFLRFWDGTTAESHMHDPSLRYGLLQTHAATVALFAWLAAAGALAGRP